jgi:hypothetical protein
MKAAISLPRPTRTKSLLSNPPVLKTTPMTTRSNPCQRTAHIASITVVAMLVLGIALPVALLIWQTATPRVPIRSGGVGRFLSAASESPFLRPSVTDVQTTDGSLIVSGLFSAPRGQVLEVVQFNQDNATYLCATNDLGTCVPLAGTWAGAMKALATADRSFDFGRYGLTTSNLWLWLACGCLVCVLAVFIRFLALAVNTEASRGASKHPNLEGPRA